MEWRSRAIGDRDDLRLVAAGSLHVTLAFLGARPEEEVDEVAAAMSGAVSRLPVARLRVDGVKPVPPRRPRLFALDLVDVDGRAAVVQSAVSEALTEAGFYSPERRRFWPHVTFARIRRGTGPVAPVSLVPPVQPFTAAMVTLYRSYLSPRGSHYEALAETQLTRSRH